MGCGTLSCRQRTGDQFRSCQGRLVAAVWSSNGRTNAKVRCNGCMSRMASGKRLVEQAKPFTPQRKLAATPLTTSILQKWFGEPTEKLKSIKQKLSLANASWTMARPEPERGDRTRNGKERERKDIEDDKKLAQQILRSSRFIFANITSLNEKAKVRLIERGDDVMLLAETHCAKKEAEAFLKLLGGHSWCGTTSPAQPTERSDKGTAGGVLAAVKNY